MLEHLGGLVFGRNRHSRARARQTFVARIDRQGQRREPGLDADPLRHELIQRNRVAERTAARVRGCRDKAHISRVTAVHVGIRHTAEYREVLPVLLQQLQIRRRLVVLVLPFREEIARQQAQIIIDREHPPRLRVRRQRRRGLRPACERRQHRVQKRQRQGYSRPAQKMTAGYRPSGRNEGSVLLGLCFHGLFYLFIPY